MEKETNSSENVPLEKALLAFQKALSRANSETDDTRKKDIGYLQGVRNLYSIQSLKINLSAGIKIPRNPSTDNFDQVFVDFEAGPEGASLIEFEVEAVPLEPVKGPVIILSRQGEIRESFPENHFMVGAIIDGNTVGGMPLFLRFIPGRPGIELPEYKLKAGLTGFTRFSINTKNGALSVENQVVEKIDFQGDQEVYIQVTGSVEDQEETKIPLESDPLPLAFYLK